jgi:hypothetical protein
MNGVFLTKNRSVYSEIESKTFKKKKTPKILLIKGQSHQNSAHNIDPMTS